MNRREFLRAGTAVAGALGAGWPRPALAQAKTIEIWSHAPAGSASVVERAVAHVVASFSAANPGVDVRVTSMPWQQISPTLLRSVKAGKVPDIAMLYSPQMAVHVDAQTLMPLDGFMAQWPAEERGDVVRLRQAEDAKGVVYGLPWQIRTSGLVYRADLLQKAGKEPPRTLGEWASTAAAVQGGDVVGMALGFSPEGSSIAGGWFLTTLLGLGSKVLNPDGTAAFTTPEAEKLVQWVHEQVNGKPPTLPRDVALLDQEKEHDLFIAKKAVFLPTSSDRHARVVDKSGLPFDAVGMTRYPTFDPGKPAPALVQSWNLVIPKGAANPDLSWRFMSHWASREVQLESAKIAGLGPVRGSVLKDAFFERPEGKVIRFATEYASQDPMKFEFPTNSEVLYDTWVKMFGQVFSNQMSAKDGLAWAASQFDRRVRR